MNRAARLGLFLLAAMLAALALRCPQLDIRPMHNDEGVNAIKFQTLHNQGSYHYDPNEFHGPTLPYFTWLVDKLSGGSSANYLSEIRLRTVNVLFGVGLILLLPLVADALGYRATACAAFLITISPAMVFYSRYYIHEILLGFFTLLTIAAGWRYTRTRKLGWAMLTGAAIGLMQATKETFVLTLAAILMALLLNWIWIQRIDASDPPSQFKVSFPHVAAGLVIWLAVAFVLLSSFLTNLNGPLDAFRAYLPWTHRAQGSSPHIHPWNFYLERLTFFHNGSGPVFTETFILILAGIGIITTFTRKGTVGANVKFLRFLAFYTLIITAIYAAIPYKTPWCLLTFWQGMILMAGFGAVALINLMRRRAVKIAVNLLLLIGAAHLTLQARQLSTTYAADRKNPYIYSQTSPDILNLVAKVNAIAQASPEKNQVTIKVMASGSEYWPLPYYLRDFPSIGWYSAIPQDPEAPIMIASTDLHANLDKNKTHLMVGLFELRPKTFFELYVDLDLWRTYLNTIKPKAAEP
ncbi:flippase activity-associated protein Agl23 [Pedosphaera parvula]|uniref:Glycosyl transferase family 39 n=1 Tax=Pedosphaera parvula (strain Ellin514) TaxID=320771 RepID=B9XK66_PEDPL|nr:flippase activity-associated protein Agl23 [Pedosphaera parvula]EEF59704.1 glycosyl transferase family 39 [Pedosphaera parvula Ellin514]